MNRPTCVHCKGTGRVKRMSFVNANKKIEEDCAYCHGKKTSKCLVDLFDVIDWLEQQPETIDKKALITSLHKKFTSES